MSPLVKLLNSVAKRELSLAKVGGFTKDQVIKNFPQRAEQLAKVSNSGKTVRIPDYLSKEYSDAGFSVFPSAPTPINEGLNPVIRSDQKSMMQNLKDEVYNMNYKKNQIARYKLFAEQRKSEEELQKALKYLPVRQKRDYSYMLKYRPERAADSLQRNLEKRLSKGYGISRDSSRLSDSQYLYIDKLDDNLDAVDTIEKIRIADHDLPWGYGDVNGFDLRTGKNPSEYLLDVLQSSLKSNGVIDNKQRLSEILGTQAYNSTLGRY